MGLTAAGIAESEHVLLPAEECTIEQGFDLASCGGFAYLIYVCGRTAYVMDQFRCGAGQP